MLWRTQNIGAGKHDMAEQILKYALGITYCKSYIGFIHNMIAIVCARIPGSYIASVMYPDTLFPMGFATPAGSFISIVICVGAFVRSFSKAATCKKLYKVI